MKRFFNWGGLLICLIGIIGWAGWMESPLFGQFQVNTFHNILHTLTGAGMVYAAMKGNDIMRASARALGGIYGVIAVFGYFMGGDFFDLMWLNMPDHILHGLLSLANIYFGFFWKPSPPKKEQFGAG